MRRKDREVQDKAEIFKAVIYFHCAQQGLKVELLKANPRVCVEGDIFIRVEKTTHGITVRYESVIGFGECQLITDTDEIMHGLRVLLDHYGQYDYPLDRCMGISHLFVGKIVLDEITGKRNLPGAMTSADRAAVS